MVRGRDELVAERVAAANPLRSLLDSDWPGAVAIFAAIDSSIALSFVERYPTPKSARPLGPKRLARFLAAHRYSGRRSPDALLERLRGAPGGKAGELEVEASASSPCAWSPRRAPSSPPSSSSPAPSSAPSQSSRSDASSCAFPRARKINAAQIVAELGDDPARFGSEASLAAQAGAPVTYASGKKLGVGFRWAANKRLRVAITTFANNSRHSNEWARGVYRRARSRGKDHPHAVRILARAWVRVLWRCWVDGAPYDPDKHLSARALGAA